MIEYRFAISLGLAAVVGTVGLHVWPFPAQHPLIGLIAAKTLFQAYEHVINAEELGARIAEGERALARTIGASSRTSASACSGICSMSGRAVTSARSKRPRNLRQ